LSAALPAPEPAIGSSAADRRLAIGGGACIAASVVAVLLRLSGALPSGLATLLVLMIATVGLRLFVSYASKSATSARRAHVTGLISGVGLAMSAAALLFALPVISRVGGADSIATDAFAHGWPLLLLTLAVGTVRTLGWRTLAGSAMTGFLAIPGLAYLVGRPVIDALGTTSAVATAVWVPFTEELVKALPILLVVVFAARRSSPRVSAAEMGLLGAWVGAAFAVYENAQYGRGTLDWSAIPVLSVLNPATSNVAPFGFAYAAAGHMAWTALIGLGLGVGVLYRHVDRRARLAVPIAFSVAIGEHCVGNNIALTSHDEPLWLTLGRVLTLNGWSSTILLIAGLAYVVRREQRAAVTRGDAPLKVRLAESLWLPPALAAERGAALALLQSGASMPSPPPPPGGSYF
jgi:RsiW-degrading membrane proteinase PrsW (M82 family)